MPNSSPASFLSRPLASLLPGAHTADLIAAALGDGDTARYAWQRWLYTLSCEPKKALAADRVVARPLLSLLYDSVRRNSLPLDPETMTYMRSASLHESLRMSVYLQTVDELSAILDGAGIPFLLIKGASTSRQYYADPSLRHVHDIEILVDDVVALNKALTGTRFRDAELHWIHECGLPLRAHTSLFVPPLELDHRLLWKSAIRLTAGMKTLDHPHMLAQVLVHASRSVSRESCRWVCDAHAIIRAGVVNWDRFLETVTATGAALPVRVQLLWMQDSFGLQIPPTIMTTLAAHAETADSVELEIVIRGLYAGRFQWWRRLWSEGSWPMRRLLISSAINIPRVRPCGD